MKVKFWGTRGSIPTPGKDTVRYGGNTPCVEVRLGGDQLLIFDAGTGIRGLGDALIAAGKPVKAFVVISHPHWDHIQGFPFFKPAFVSGNELTIIGPRSKYVTLRQMISDQMDKVYFPIRLSELKAKITFKPIKEESLPVYDATLTSCYVNHPSISLGYRLDVGGRSLVYISDNEPFDRDQVESVKNVEKVVVDSYNKVKGDPNGRVYDFARGADILIHDSTYTPEEYNDHIGWGHSHYLFALKVAEEARAKRLVLFHHNQSHSDDAVDDILRTCRGEIKRRKLLIECSAAAEGQELEW